MENTSSQENFLLPEENSLSLLEQLPEAVLIVNAEGFTQYANPAAVALLAIGGQSLFNIPISQIGIPDFLKSVNKTTELEITNQNGGLSFLQFRVVSINWHGHPAYLVTVHNINARKWAEESLENGKFIFQNVAQTISDAMIIMDDTGEIIIFNHSAEQLYGYSTEEIIGEKFYQLFPQDHRPKFYNFYNFLTVEMPIIHGVPYEEQGFTKNGEILPIQMVLNPILVANRRLVIANIHNLRPSNQAEDNIKQIVELHEQKISSLNDALIKTEKSLEQAKKEIQQYNQLVEATNKKINELLHVQEHLKKEITTYTDIEKKFRDKETYVHNWLDNTPVLLWIVDNEGSIIFAGGKPPQPQNLDPTLMIGKSINYLFGDLPQFAENIHRAHVEDTFSDIIIIAGTHYKTIYTPLRNDQNQNIGTALLLLDISEDKKAEKNKLQFQHQIEETLAACQTDLADLNNKYLDQSAILLKTKEELQHNQQQSEEKVKERTSPLYQIIEQMRHNLDEQQQSLEEFNNEKQQLIQKFNQQSTNLSIASTAFERAIQIREDFFASINSELVDPLYQILNLSKVLLSEFDGPLNPHQEQNLQSIINSSNLLLNLINDMIDLAKIKTGQFHLDIKDTNVNNCIDFSTQQIQPLFQQKNITLSTSNDSKEITILIDEQRLKQILINLLNHVIETTKEGGKISLDVHVDQSDMLITFSIRTNIVNITPDEISSVFYDFSNTTHNQINTYASMNLIYHLVELQGGSISVENKPENEERRYIVSLPLDLQSLPPDSSQDVISKPVHNNNLNSTNAHSVLIIERCEAYLIHLISQFRSYGYQVMIARSEEEAIDIIRTCHPALLLLNLQIPSSKNLGIIRHIRSKRDLNKIPIITTTALDLPGNRVQCLEAGANAYYVKPINIKNLIQSIDPLFKK